jgi:hypothetical protein
MDPAAVVGDPPPGAPKPGGRQPEADRGGAEVLMASRLSAATRLPLSSALHDLR